MLTNRYDKSNEGEGSNLGANWFLALFLCCARCSGGGAVK